MPSYVVYLWLAQLVPLVFVIAFGACIGSLTNVIVYRLPLGMGIVTPPSRCPSCATRLTWRENIPVFGWLLLRGRCRFCRAKISPEYPIVEASVGLLFGVFYALYYIVPGGSNLLGIDWGGVKPEWAMAGLPHTWPAFAVLLALLGSLVAMTLVDAKTFTIPLMLTWFPAIVAVVVHPLHALWIQLTIRRLPVTAPGEVWAIATPGPAGWWWIGGAIGGVLGLAVANLLVATGLLRRSFADYEAWERSVTAVRPDVVVRAADGAGAIPPADGPETGAAMPQPEPGPLPRPQTSAIPADLWIQYPHARREMVKEVLFLAPALGLGFVGAALAHRLAGPWTFDLTTFREVPAVHSPLWLTVLAGVLMGYLIGGGVVWAVRILGSLGFGKEAMGLGDVHLMAAVGACLGWIDATLAFFAAAFVGLAWAVLAGAFSGTFRRAMPYGPFLAVATVLVLLTKPLIELGLTRLTGGNPPINIP